MSNTWWNSVQTTHGHGIVSQHASAHAKEWIQRENRKQSRADGAAFDGSNSFFRSSLHEPIDSQPIENLHSAKTKSLSELRTLQCPPGNLRHTCRNEVPPQKVVEQPLTDGTYHPHLSHKHHYGWNPPTPMTDLQSATYKAARKNGDALAYLHKVGHRLPLVSSRKP
mmetsp:Transcript_26769/g.79510  ORF Transcript_26769/g.79510 Transcript_26769/m.79510 type:complete len:167 (-) Transcript_26769:108-608(-)